MSYHTIESHLNGKVLNVENGQPNAGARIILYGKSHPASTNELFRFEDAGIGGGWFHIATALGNNLVLDVEGGQPKGGSKLIVYPRQYPPKDNQLFRWHGGNCLQSKLGDDMVIDIEGSNTNDGAAVILWNHKGAENQHWRT